MAEYTRFDLPGLNRPLDFIGREFQKISRGEAFRAGITPSGKPHFPSLLKPDSSSTGVIFPLTTLREFKMLRIMDGLTDKPDWDKKVFDNLISEKWKVEMMSMEGPEPTVTQKMADFIIAELRFKAQRQTDNLVVYNGDVVKSDTAVPLAVKESLQEAARILEDVPEYAKDYHPGSGRQVLDLVHQSLFPLVYGRTRILEDRLIGLEDAVSNCCNGITLPPRTEGEGSYGFSYSRVFQWLPCEVDVSGDSAKITSYINNLHPQQNKDLYEIIEKVIDCAIPLWNLTLFPLNGLDYKYDPANYFSRIAFNLQYRDVPEELVPNRGEYEDEYEYSDRRTEFICKEGLIHPEPDEFDPKAFAGFLPESNMKEKEPLNIKKDFGDEGLQVIVKLANIELTPETPSYAGGSWHIEGQNNEHICATALYYYDCSNITESRLGFRQMSDAESIEEQPYEQEQHGWLWDIFGCENHGPAVQRVGSVLCREGRLITFPNILQHCVYPFKLLDPTKPGHRKIVALFLVDPTIKIISTANVPPQQKTWWAEQVDADAMASEKGLGKLSAELKEKVFRAVEDFPIGMTDARKLRLELMEERKIYVHQHNDQLEGEAFNLCEH